MTSYYGASGKFTEVVQIAANGTPYEGWEEIVISWEVGAPYITFQLATTELTESGNYPNPPDDVLGVWNFPPGTMVDVYATGSPIVRGYINSYNPQVTPQAHSVLVTGVTKGKDFAESSVDHPTGWFENQPDFSIVQQFAAASGVGIDNFAQPSIVPRFQIRQGATNFAEAMRVLTPHAKTLTPQAVDGSLAIVGADPLRVNPNGQLVQGQNILQMSASLKNDAFARYKVFGQNPIGTIENLHLQPFGLATVASAMPGRFKKINDQTATNMAQALELAHYNAMRDAGFNMQAEITVPGWRDNAGQFWEAYTDVWVEAPWLQISCSMRIKKAVFKQNIPGGTITQLTLVDPRTYGGSGVCKSGDMWQIFSPRKLGSAGDGYKPAVP
jgi:prophage tail gpP-like protein